MPCWKTTTDGGQIANARHVHAETNNHSRNDTDTSKRCRNEFGDARHNPDDRHRRHHKTQHHIKRTTRQPFATRHAVTVANNRTGHFELGHLSQENNDR